VRHGGEIGGWGHRQLHVRDGGGNSRVARGQGREAADVQAPWPQYWVVAKFDSKSKFKRIQIVFKFVQTLITPKMTFLGTNFF
jgi:hypothetical protein